MKKRILSAFLISLLMLLLSSCVLPFPEVPDGDEVSYAFYLDGELYGTVEVSPGESFRTPSVDVPSGYRFDGWYADSAYTTEYDGEQTAYARLLPNEYTVTVYGEDGALLETIPYTVLSEAFSLSAPQAPSGYTFRGYREGTSETVYTSVTFPKGSFGDREFHLVYSAIEYTISYDYNGGVGENPESYTVVDPTFALEAPTRQGYTFLGWQIGEEVFPTVTVALGSIGDFSVKALWAPQVSNFTMESSPSGIPLGVRFGDEDCVTGTEITVTAPAICGSYVFLGWYDGDTCLSTSSALTFQKPAGTTAITAKYEPISVYTYDKRTGGALTLPYHSGRVPTELHGADIRYYEACEFSSGTVVIDEAALLLLEEGDYTLYILSEGASMYLTLRVVNTSVPSYLSVNYDTPHFPAVEIDFDCSCGGEHSYSLDGDNAVLCRDGDVIVGYDKTAKHTLTLTCLSTGHESSVSIDGYISAAEEYYTTSFTYLGNTYDYAIMSEEELRILIEYLALVRGVLEGERESDTYDFWIDGALFEQYKDATAFGDLLSSVIRNLSLPMSPTFSTYVGSIHANYKGISVKYESGFNSVVSTQEKTAYEDTQGYLSTTGREVGFDDFPIDAYGKTVEIRTLYELETLPYGYRPVFAESATLAAEVYQAARDILCTIIDDRMNDYEKVVAIYAWLGLNVTYDDVTYASGGSVYRAFTSYGAIIDRLAVCDGYASAFNIFCAIEGIRSVEVTGLAATGEQTMGHAWNKVYIDGAWYGADPTWAGNGGRVTMEYLFMDEQMLLYTGHFENAGYTDRSTEIVCNGAYSYFESVFTEGVSYDLVIESADELIAALRYMMENGLSVLEIKCFYTNISDWLQRAVNELDIDRLSYSSLGDGYYYFLLN